MQQIVFHNWSDEDFVCGWNGAQFCFEASKVYSQEDVLFSEDGQTRLLLEPGIVDVFARHLAIREMDKAGVNQQRLDVYEEFCARAKSLEEAPEEKEEKPKAKKAKKSSTSKKKTSKKKEESKEESKEVEEPVEAPEEEEEEFEGIE